MNAPSRQRLAAAQALVFDFDGTLAPNLDLAAMRQQVVQLTLARGVPNSAFSNAHIVEIIALGERWLTRSSKREARAYAASAHTLITQFELAAAEHARVYPQARALLQSWRARGRRSAIVTRNCRAAVLGTYPQALKEVDVLLARDDVQHLKPDARHMEQALTALGTQGKRAVMFGDGQMDMAIGRAHALYCVGVLGGSCDRETLLQAGADCVIDGVAALLPLLDTL